MPMLHLVYISTLGDLTIIVHVHSFFSECTLFISDHNLFTFITFIMATHSLLE